MRERSVKRTVKARRVLTAVLLAMTVAWPTVAVPAHAGDRQVSPSASREDRTHTAAIRTSRRGTQRVTVDHLRRAILGYLEGRLEGRVSEVEVEVVDPSDPIVVPAGRLRIEVAAGPGVEQSGRRRFHVVPTVDGRPGEEIEVLTDISLFADVVVPARMIRPEEIIEPEDLSSARVKVSVVPHQMITHMTEAVGKSPGRILHAQQPIRTASLVRPFTVRKGDRVTIEARRGGLAIHAAGTTKTSGQLGSFITVTNADSGKDIRAKVVGPGLVQVEF